MRRVDYFVGAIGCWISAVSTAGHAENAGSPLKLLLIVAVIGWIAIGVKFFANALRD